MRFMTLNFFEKSFVGVRYFLGATLAPDCCSKPEIERQTILLFKKLYLRVLAMQNNLYKIRMQAFCVL